MRWAYRIGSCLSPAYRGVRHAQPVQSFPALRSVQRREPQPPLVGPIGRQQRALCPPPPSASRRDFSSSPISPQVEPPKPQDAQHSGKKRSSLSPAVVVVSGSILAAVAASLLWWPNSDDGDVINKSTFRAFTITSKEQVSPTAFLLAVRSSSNDGGGSARIRQAWAHGLWSVEIKQPQLQIARHYTPLPPLPSSSSPTSTSTTTERESGHHNDHHLNERSGTGGDDDELRFLIRKMDGGEMSSYLSRLRVGDAVWLRGPHLGFDVARRLGGDGGGDGGGGRSVVFLAGGTGVAPALQVAHRLLDGGGGGVRGNIDEQRGQDGEGEGGHEHDTPAAADRPVISILWANRRGVDALGRPAAAAAASRAGWWGSLGGFWKQGSGGGSGGDESDKTTMTEEEVPSLSRQIREMQKRYPDNFRVRYFVDEEKSFIGAEDVIAAVAAATGAARIQKEAAVPPKRLAPAAAEACPWHSAAALETLPNDDDASRSGGGGERGDDGTSPPCPCSCGTAPGEQAGMNLLFVSGPDGFIEAYAGPKKWHTGGEMQSPVRGLVGRLKDRRGELDGWLVLKL